MSDTTNLADLPSDPTIQQNISSMNNAENIVLETNDVQNNNPELAQQKIMNEFVSGIQQASASGATSLPSRDIPQKTVQFNDEQTQPNYVPQPNPKEEYDYIQNNSSEDEILYRRQNQSKDSLEVLYEEFQIPIIIGLLFFIFQLPVVKSRYLSLLPSLHNSDGNPKLTGFVINSFFFAMCFYVIHKSFIYFQNV